MQNLQTQFIETNNITLHCKVAGNPQNPLLILLHGFPEFWYAWHKQIPALAEKYYVVAPDMRGYNLSSKPEGVKNYTTQMLVNDILGIIKWANKPDAYLVGHDWGGIVAWQVASFHPEKIKKLAVLNIPHPAELINQILKKGNWRQFLKSWYILFFQLPTLPEKYVGKNIPLFFKKALKGWSINKQAFTDEDIQTYIAAFPNQQSFTAPINYYRAALRYPAKHVNGRLPLKIQCPVLMLWGENDRALGKELTYNTYKYCASELQTLYVPNCSHWIQHEKPEWVSEQLLQFLEK